MKTLFSPKLSKKQRELILSEVRSSAKFLLSVYEKQIFVLPAGEHPAILEIFKNHLNAEVASLLLNKCPLAVVIGAVGIEFAVLKNFNTHIDADTGSRGGLFELNCMLENPSRVSDLMVKLAINESVSHGARGEVNMATVAFATYLQLLAFITDDEKMRAVEKFVEKALFYAGSSNFLTKLN